MCSEFDVSKCPPERSILRVDAATAIGDLASTCCAEVGVPLTGGGAGFHEAQLVPDSRIEGVHQMPKGMGWAKLRSSLKPPPSNPMLSKFNCPGWAGRTVL